MIFDFCILAFWHFTSSAGSSVFFSISCCSQGGEHPFTDFDLTGEFISKKKTVASKHKCGDAIPKKPVFCRFLAQKQGIFDGIFRFQKTVSPNGDFSPEDKSLIRRGEEQR
jgi:hypothetical protein